jgi:hypothetical protein
MTMQSPFDPFWLFRLPLSGNVAQRFFSPALTVNYAGNAAVEERVVTDVASYGRQIGWLNKLVLDLVHGDPPDDDTLKQLADAVDAIEAIKKQHGKSTLEGAITALDQLEAEQADAYRHLLDGRVRRLAPARP